MDRVKRVSTPGCTTPGLISASRLLTSWRPRKFKDQPPEYGPR